MWQSELLICPNAESGTSPHMLFSGVVVLWPLEMRLFLRVRLRAAPLNQPQAGQ